MHFCTRFRFIFSKGARHELRLNLSQFFFRLMNDSEKILLFFLKPTFTREGQQIKLPTHDYALLILSSDSLLPTLEFSWSFSRLYETSKDFCVSYSKIHGH